MIGHPFPKENIKAEKQILKYLTTKTKSPQSIVKYVDFFRSNFNYYLVRYYLINRYLINVC